MEALPFISLGGEEVLAFVDFDGFGSVFFRGPGLGSGLWAGFFVFSLACLLADFCAFFPFWVSFGIDFWEGFLEPFPFVVCGGGRGEAVIFGFGFMIF